MGSHHGRKGPDGILKRYSPLFNALSLIGLFIDPMTKYPVNGGTEV